MPINLNVCSKTEMRPVMRIKLSLATLIKRVKPTKNKRLLLCILLSLILGIQHSVWSQETQSPLLDSWKQYMSMKQESEFGLEWISLGPVLNSARVDATGGQDVKQKTCVARGFSPCLLQMLRNMEWGEFGRLASKNKFTIRLVWEAGLNCIRISTHLYVLGE